MKLSTSVLDPKYWADKSKLSDAVQLMPIQLVSKIPATPTKEQTVGFDVPYTTNQDGKTYKMYIHRVDGSDLETALKFKEEVIEAGGLFEKLGMTEASDKYAMTRSILTAEALDAFNNEANEQGNPTGNRFKKCIDSMLNEIAPSNTIYNLRRGLKKLKKPHWLPIKQFYDRWNTIYRRTMLLPNITREHEFSEVTKKELFHEMAHADSLKEFNSQGKNLENMSIKEVMEFHIQQEAQIALNKPIKKKVTNTTERNNGKRKFGANTQERKEKNGASTAKWTITTMTIADTFNASNANVTIINHPSKISINIKALSTTKNSTLSLRKK